MFDTVDEGQLHSLIEAFDGVVLRDLSDALVLEGAFIAHAVKEHVEEIEQALLAELQARRTNH